MVLNDMSASFCIMYYYTSPLDPFLFLCLVQLEELREKNRLAKQKERAEKRKKGKEASSEDTPAKKRKVKKVKIDPLTLM